MEKNNCWCILTLLAAEQISVSGRRVVHVVYNTFLIFCLIFWCCFGTKDNGGTIYSDLHTCATRAWYPNQCTVQSCHGYQCELCTLPSKPVTEPMIISWDTLHESCNQLSVQLKLDSPQLWMKQTPRAHSKRMKEDCALSFTLISQNKLFSETEAVRGFSLTP